MNQEATGLEMKGIEALISHIGAKVADAIDLSQQAKELSLNSHMLLIQARQELEELYLSLSGKEEDNTSL